MLWYSCVILFISLHYCCANLSDGKYEGDDCILKNNQKGKCVRLSLCPSAIEIIKNKQHPETCSYENFIPVVCCPVGEKLTTRISERKCSMFQKVKLKLIEEFSTKQFDARNLNTHMIFTSSPVISQEKSNLNNNTNQTEEIYEFPTAMRSPNQNDTNSTIDYSQYVLANIPESADPDIREILNTNISGINVVPTNNSYNITDNLDDLELPVVGIIGGTKVVDAEFPHMAALGFAKEEKILWLCGGSLISEKFVLTAAHCLSSSEYGNIQWVGLGTSRINVRSVELFNNPYQQVIKIIRRIRHPLYKRPATYHDIALVEMERSVEFTIKLKPACLQVSHDLNFKEQLIATGWGLTEFGGNASEILMKVKLDVFTWEECAEIYKDMKGTRRLMQGIDQEMQICAGRRQGREDTCSGDSGGPLQIQINSNNGPTYALIGITSFGKACGIYGIPGVYTRVSKYVPWIESIIWPDEI